MFDRTLRHDTANNHEKCFTMQAYDLYLSISLSIYLSFYLSIYPSITVYTNLSISIYTYTHTHIYIYIYRHCERGREAHACEQKREQRHRVVATARSEGRQSQKSTSFRPPSTFPHASTCPRPPALREGGNLPNRLGQSPCFVPHVAGFQRDSVQIEELERSRSSPSTLGRRTAQSGTAGGGVRADARPLLS